MIKGLITVVCLVAAAFSFYKFQTTPDANTMYMVGGIVFAILAVVFGILFLSGRVNKTEDIHITE
jgi:hypothetical protein